MSLVNLSVNVLQRQTIKSRNPQIGSLQFHYCTLSNCYLKLCILTKQQILYLPKNKTKKFPLPKKLLPFHTDTKYPTECVAPWGSSVRACKSTTDQQPLIAPDSGEAAAHTEALCNHCGSWCLRKPSCFFLFATPDSCRHAKCCFLCAT